MMTKLHSNPFGDMFKGVVLPILILVAASLIVATLKKEMPRDREVIEDDPEARLNALPAAYVGEVMSLQNQGSGILEINIDGVVVPYREIRIAAEVSGTIVHKYPICEAGNYVSKGENLFEIDTTDYQLELDRLNKQRETEQAALDEIEQEIANALALIVVAQEDEKVRQNEIERLTELKERGFGSLSEMDRATQSMLQARNVRVGLQNQEKLLESKKRRQQKAMELVDSQLDIAQKNLDRCTIKAPIAGVIYREDAELNSFVQRGALIVTMEDTSKAEVAANVRMEQLYWILDQTHSHSVEAARSYHVPKTEAIVKYTMKGRDIEYRWKGVLERYDGIGVQSDSRMVPLRIVVDTPDERHDEESSSNEDVPSESGEQDDSLVTLQGSFRPTSLVESKASSGVPAEPNDHAEIAPQPNRTEKESRGPKALVRGMYVSVVLKVRPKTQLWMVPKQAINPGNRIWKFVGDRRVLDQTKDAHHVRAKQKDTQSDVWEPGFIHRLDVHPITPITINQGAARSEYLICELVDHEDSASSSKQQLTQGDQVIVSPLRNGATASSGDPAQSGSTSSRTQSSDGVQ